MLDGRSAREVEGRLPSLAWLEELEAVVEAIEYPRSREAELVELNGSLPAPEAERETVAPRWSLRGFPIASATAASELGDPSSDPGELCRLELFLGIDGGRDRCESTRLGSSIAPTPSTGGSIGGSLCWLSSSESW